MVNATLQIGSHEATDTAPVLLRDSEMISFVIRGYLVLQPDLPDAFHAAVYDDIAALFAGRTDNPGDAILDLVPALHQVWTHPRIHGALISLLGADYRMNSHRHCHVSAPGMRSQAWHQDGVNQRHHQIRTVLGFYYPQDVTPELGPTVVLPGSHFRNAATDQMATYANLRDQVLLSVPAGTVVLAHYDIWHAGTRNEGTHTRYGCKFLFDRASEPVTPSWNHDPEQAQAEVSRLIFEKACACSQSEHYKERELRAEMWSHLLGGQGRGCR
jgi:hypothetical protein